MDLSSYTKADLEWIIERLLTKPFWGRGEYELSRVLNELKYEKEKALLDEADLHAEIAYKKRMDYYNLMEPYKGQFLADIPKSVLDTGRKLLAEAEEADKKWAKAYKLSEGK